MTSSKLTSKPVTIRIQTIRCAVGDQTIVPRQLDSPEAAPSAVRASLATMCFAG